MSVSVEIGEAIASLLATAIPAKWKINVVGKTDNDAKSFPMISISISEPVPEIYQSRLFSCNGTIVASVFQPDDIMLSELADTSAIISEKLNEATITTNSADSLAVVIHQTAAYNYTENEVTTSWEITVVGRKK